MVFQHVPYEPLGTLDPLIRSQRHRIRYVNFGRKPAAKPDLDGYDALIILGGPMNIGDEQQYPHLEVEKRVIRQAIDANMPVLGICLGAQLIAAALGEDVYPAAEKEIGWYQMGLTTDGEIDPVVKAFKQEEKIFQWHGYTFNLPAEAKLLVEGRGIANQAFKINNNVYGFQFHLEASLPLIQRWLKLPAHLEELGLSDAEARVETIWSDTLKYMDRSLILSRQVFNQFLTLLPKVKETHRFTHRQFDRAE